MRSAVFLKGIDTEYNMSNLNLLPSDTLLAMSSIVPDTDIGDSSETNLCDSHLLPEQLIALKPLDEFRTEQQSCPETGTIYKHLKATLLNAKQKKNSKFNVKLKFYFIDPSDDCLHYEDPLLESGESNVKPLVVQKSLRHFLYSHHNAPLTGGHRGRDATLAALRSHYYWPGMVRDTSREGPYQITERLPNSDNYRLKHVDTRKVCQLVCAEPWTKSDQPSNATNHKLSSQDVSPSPTP